MEYRNYLNKQNKNIKFTSKVEENSSLSFLDIKISRENNKFVTEGCRKPTFICIFFKNFKSFILDIYKHGLIYLNFTEVDDYVPITRIFIVKLKL